VAFGLAHVLRRRPQTTVLDPTAGACRIEQTLDLWLAPRTARMAARFRVRPKAPNRQLPTHPCTV
jgi:hypothetical protein